MYDRWADGQRTTDNRPQHKLTWSKAPGELIIKTLNNRQVALKLVILITCTCPYIFTKIILNLTEEGLSDLWSDAMTLFHVMMLNSTYRPFIMSGV